MEEGVADGETSADEDFNKKHENSLKFSCDALITIAILFSNHKVTVEFQNKRCHFML